MDNPIVLETKHLKKIYNYRTNNAFEALHDINIQVREGEFVAVMGPSGSGKTTFINNISTIDEPTMGKVLINGKDITSMSTTEVCHFRYKNLGFIFQNFNLLETHTICENIAMPLTMAEEKNNVIDQIVRLLANQMNIGEILDKFPSACSTGQKQRAAICRALINHPNIIMADEPTGSLDSINSSEMMKIMQRMNKENVTIIMVTHDPLIASYSHRLIYIKDGNIEKELIRGDMKQHDYFLKIVEISTEESRGIISDDDPS